MYNDKKVINLINEDNNIDLDILDNEHYEINIYNDVIDTSKIVINIYNNATLFLNLSGYVNADAIVNILVRIIGSNNKCNIKTRSIGLRGKGTINASVVALEKTVNNEILEDLKGINEEGKIELNPVLEINTNEVNASHFATVGGFNSDELFYLQSKGISLNMAKNLLKKVFIYNIFTKDFFDLIKYGKE